MGIHPSTSLLAHAISVSIGYLLHLFWGKDSLAAERVEEAIARAGRVAGGECAVECASSLEKLQRNPDCSSISFQIGVTLFSFTLGGALAWLIYLCCKKETPQSSTVVISGEVTPTSSEFRRLLALQQLAEVRSRGRKQQHGFPQPTSPCVV